MRYKSEILILIRLALGVFVRNALLIFLLAACSLVQANSSQTEKSYEIFGWNETVVSVRNIDDYQTFFLDIAKWELRQQGDVSRAQLDAWQLPKKSSAKFKLYANKGTDSGYIRLVQFAGVEQIYMRQDSQSWDTGGIFDINMRVKDIDDVAAKLRALGWKSRAPITRFVFGPFDVKEWIVASPDGLEIALIDRISPELEGWDHFKTTSRTFNSTQVVRDFDQALKFYKDILGFKMTLEMHGYLSKEDGPNSLGFPYNLQTVNPRKVFIMSPKGDNEGSVELLKVLGLDGADHSAHTKMPNFGIGSLRFPVKNLDALNKYLKQQKVDWVHSLKDIGEHRSLTIKSPEGAWMEFYE